MSENDFEALLREAMEDPVVRTASKEHSKRRAMAEIFEAARRDRNWSLRDLAMAMRTSRSQVQRLLDRRSGDSLTLRTIINAADALELEVQITVMPRFVAAVNEETARGQWYRGQAPARVIRLPIEKAVAEPISESPEWAVVSDDEPVAAAGVS